MDENVKPIDASAGEAAAAGSATSDSVDVADSAALLAALAAERDQTAKERADLHDQLLRLRAEFENFRKRAQRERREFTEFAAREAVRVIVPVLDDFERALKAESSDKEYAKGMELIYQRLMDTLKKLGLEPIEAEGKKFDPAHHHAVEMEKTDSVEDHTVLYQHQRGYNFKGTLLRPAMVKVAVKP
jgi:molecular chaperone GrpE